jgi:hypothetical protein
LAVQVLGCSSRLIKFALKLIFGITDDGAGTLFDLAADIFGCGKKGPPSWM